MVTDDTAGRTSAVTLTTEFLPGPYPLEDFWQGRASVDYFYWGRTDRPPYDHRSGGLGIVEVSISMPPESHAFLHPGRVYYGFRLRVSHSGTTATQGCNDGICFIPDLVVLRRSGNVIQNLAFSDDPLGPAQWHDGVPECILRIPAIVNSPIG
jgi:hypothetical protein